MTIPGKKSTLSFSPHAQGLDGGGAARGDALTLASLECGDSALVVHCQGLGQTLTEKLGARGIVPGAVVTVLNTGNPVMVRVDDTRWAITRQDADAVCVTPIGAAEESTPRPRLGWLRRR